MYADDLQIYLHFHPNDANDAIVRLTEDLTSIFKWANKFGLKLNPEKSQVIVMGHHRLLSVLNTLPHVKINDNIVEYCETVKNLGIFMDNDLNWNSQ